MDITSLPKTYKDEKHGYNCSLTVLHEESLGWLVTYMYYEYDPLEMDFYPTLQGAIKALTEKLEIKPDLITEKWLEDNGYKKEIYLGEPQWVSQDRRIIVSKGSNMVGRDWYVHIDNKDFQTIGGLAVQEIWQLRSILELTE